MQIYCVTVQLYPYIHLFIASESISMATFFKNIHQGLIFRMQVPRYFYGSIYIYFKDKIFQVFQFSLSFLIFDKSFL